MPKMKTKSVRKSASRVTSSGKIKVAQAGKRHGMINAFKKFMPSGAGHKRFACVLRMHVL